MRAVFTLAEIDQAGKVAAAIGADKANVGRAVVKSTTCPYAAVVASLTPVTTGIAFC